VEMAVGKAFSRPVGRHLKTAIATIRSTVQIANLGRDFRRTSGDVGHVGLGFLISVRFFFLALARKEFSYLAWCWRFGQRLPAIPHAAW